MLSDRRAKIVATIGPASNSKEILKDLISSGVNVVRLNFSHGTHEDHLKVIGFVRELRDELRAPVTLLQDLQGPKIRVGKFKEGAITLAAGARIEISPKFKEGLPSKIPSDYEGIVDAVKPGQRILLDDGLIELEVESIKDDTVQAIVITGGVLKDRKGMNLPGANLSVDCLTKKDLADLEFGLREGVDYVALSFVRHGDDIRRLREIVMKSNPNTRIVSKIEMLEALNHLKDIVRLSDAVMVARGDLAVEVGQTQLPFLQKKIIKMANEAGKPVITATQMLESMTKNPRPTRAEVTDVANAILDGSDAVMLSAESASGDHPVQAVSTMHEIILEVEKTSPIYHRMDLRQEHLSVAEAVAESACLTAMKLNAKAIVSLTTSGKTVGLISTYRPKAKILGVTHMQPTLNRLEIYWGVQTLEIEPYRTAERAMEQIVEHMICNGVAKNGDKIVLTMGLPLLERGTTNSIRVYTIKDKVLKPLENKDRPLRYIDKN